ncbi:hypothetical protein ACFFH4_05180 [Halalkalibacter alkalisediminis]|uniref:Uncharacterized protein n=1 Tax=Halalkalibacter alkalisediminis TaxID=935616 RepID=A0ABV6NCC3_9BACI
MKPDVAEENSLTYRMVMVAILRTEPYSTTRNVVGLNWGILINSQKPGKTIQSHRIVKGPFFF